MAEIVNLNRARKAKARGEKDKQAKANRVHFGTPKAVRDAAKARNQKSIRALDGHKKD